MRPDIHKWHMETLASHNTGLYESLLYPYHIVSDTLKTIEFDGKASVRGYFAKKNKNKYWVDEELLPLLPVRLGTEIEELVYKEDIVLHALNPKPFKIVPLHNKEIRQFIDSFIPFEHTNPNHWQLMKFIALMGYIGRTYVCIASDSSFGKSSAFDVMHGLTDKCPVFKPRSIPGVLKQITGNGNIVFDEIAQCEKKVREIIEEFSLQIGGGKAVYINGALASQDTKERYDCKLQSITFLYNVVENYHDCKKDYFEFIFSNNVAIDTRFLKLKLEGTLTESFDRDFDIPTVAKDNRQFYIDIAKELAYLQDLKQSNGYVRRYERVLPFLRLKGRKRQVYDEITWLIDMYSETGKEYNMYCDILEKAIMAYAEMIKLTSFQELDTGMDEVKEERIEDNG